MIYTNYFITKSPHPPELDNKEFLSDRLSEILQKIEYGRGYGNGYIVVNEEHPLYGLDYCDDNSLLQSVYVHGGFTLAQALTDDIFVKEFPLEDRPSFPLWIFGFDTTHLDDNKDNWPKERVLEETINAHEQIKKMDPIKNPEIFI